MKKIISMIFCFVIISFIAPVSANADMGPKPSVVIDFIGLEDKAYYVTLLSADKSTGPYSVVDNDYLGQYQPGDEYYDIFSKFAEYKDTDNFYFIQYFEECSQTHQFTWGYYPPDKFKILLYFPETDSFIIDNEYHERYAFDSYFSAYISDSNFVSTVQNDIIVEKSYNYAHEIISLAVRILLTVLIELAVMLLFRFREKKQILFVVFVNIVTQIVLNLTLSVISYYLGSMAFIFFYILLELLVVTIEAILYIWYFKKYSENEYPKWKPWIYALAANFVSFALGLVLAGWFPVIF